MLNFILKNRSPGRWRRVSSSGIDELVTFLSDYEYSCVPFTSRLGIKGTEAASRQFNSNIIYSEYVNGRIASALLLAPDGITCPVFSDSSSTDELPGIIPGLSYSKKQYITLMGLSENVKRIEKLFGGRNRISVDYDLLTAEASAVTLTVDAYLEKKDRKYLKNFSIRKAEITDLDYLMPLRKAYEIEEVILKPENFNENACRQRFSRTIKKQTVFYAETDNSAAATCCINAEGINWSQIGGVFTKPEYRGKGLSAVLMSGIAELCAERKKDITLFVKKNNMPALKLYSNCGFLKKGEFRISYLESR